MFAHALHHHKRVIGGCLKEPSKNAQLRFRRAGWSRSPTTHDASLDDTFVL